MKVFKKTKSNSKMEDEQANQKEPLTPQKSEDSEDSSEDGAEELEGEEEEGAFGKILNSIAGICGGGSDTTNDEWCNMKDGMAEI